MTDCFFVAEGPSRPNRPMHVTSNHPAITFTHMELRSHFQVWPCCFLPAHLARRRGMLDYFQRPCGVIAKTINEAANLR